MTTDNRQDIRNDGSPKHNDSDARKSSLPSNDNTRKESGGINSENQCADANNQGKLPDEKRSTEYCGSKELRDDDCKTDKTARDRDAVEGLESEKIMEQGRTPNNQNQPSRSDNSPRKDDERSKFNR
jgi:hypothetical protein